MNENTMILEPNLVSIIGENRVLIPCAECGGEFEATKTSRLKICWDCRRKIKSAAEVLGTRKEDIAKVCSDCGVSFVLPGVWGFVSEKIDKCPDCSEKLAVAESAAMVARCKREPDDPIEKRLNEWKKIYPFKDETIDVKLPSPDMLGKVFRWNFGGKKGLFLHGPSRTGKTRCIWKLAEREFMAGHSFSVIDAGYGYRYASLFSQDASWVEKWMNDLINVDILLCDDIFKIKVTESAEQSLFYIADKRMEKGKFTWWTTNDSAESLASRLGPDRGRALMERINETCNSISFTCVDSNKPYRDD